MPNLYDTLFGVPARAGNFGIQTWTRGKSGLFKKPENEHELAGSNVGRSEELEAIERERDLRENDRLE